MKRTAEIKRKTKETDITVRVNLDGKGSFKGNTGIGFLDHMLDLFAKHSLTDLTINATGDLHIDMHHTVEDIGITLGQAMDKALGDRKSIKRYGSFTVPMDEARAEVVVDLGGRPYFVYEVKLPGVKTSTGDFDLELLPEFFQAMSQHARMNLHVTLHAGKNLHHISEAIFKAFARAFDAAKTLDERVDGVPSTKGKI